jgi:pimeloyl-ACP methyl ester carboxylesterase
VFGLDFTGHGRSTAPVGGGYTSEILVGDVDAALEALGQVTILGRGLGAYVGLLIAAARPAQVVGVVLSDGPGLVGGGVHPGSPSIPHPPGERSARPTRSPCSSSHATSAHRTTRRPTCVSSSSAAGSSVR